MIRKYRVWFEAISHNAAVIIEGLTDKGVLIDAYDADDAIVQATIEIPYKLKGHPLWPFERITIISIAPDPEQSSITTSDDGGPGLHHQI